MRKLNKFSKDTIYMRIKQTNTVQPCLSRDR